MAVVVLVIVWVRMAVTVRRGAIAMILHGGGGGNALRWLAVRVAWTL